MSRIFKNRKTAVVAAVSVCVLLCLAAALLVYVRPRTVGERYPYLDLSQCVQAEGYFFTGSSLDDARFSLSPGEEDFDDLLSLIGSAAFRTDLATLLPPGARIHRYEEGDFGWYVMLRFDGVELPDGSMASGQLLCIKDFYGDLCLSHAYDGATLFCTLADQDRWLADIFDIISRHAE